MTYRESVEIIDAFMKQLEKAIKEDAPVLLKRDEVRIIYEAMETTAL